MSTTYIVPICPHCGNAGVQSTAWVEWDIASQRWIANNDDPPCSDDYCPHCETHVRGLDERDATPEELAQAGVPVDATVAVHESWRPMTDAPRDRRLLLRYCRDDQVAIICGEFCDDRFARMPKPYWTNDWARMFSIKWLRANPPTGWQELPT